MIFRYKYNLIFRPKEGENRRNARYLEFEHREIFTYFVVHVLSVFVLNNKEEYKIDIFFHIG